MIQDLLRLVRPTAVIGLCAAIAVALASCGGSGSAPPPPGSTTVVISGRITFERLPFSTTVGNGLNANAPVQSPARQVVVEAVGGSTILATTTTDAAGDYSLTVPSGTSLFIRAKAQMVRSGNASEPTWTFSVRNNTNADALYALDGSAASSGQTNSTRNLNAPSGWGTTSYVGTRAAAPFAILDTVFRAKELVISASSAAAFPALDLYWSPNNRDTIGVFCPDNGDIGTSFYIGPGAQDECSTPASLPTGIYILGNFASDTDEFDAHVIAHEFGHYIEDRFGRSDSIGGSHGANDRLDLRLAFGEGWGNSYSAMVQADPQYRDSFNGVSQDFGFNLDTDSGAPEGWYSEFSIGEVLWDIFDSGSEGGDTVALGFGPIFSVMTGAQVSTDALTSIFSFATALRNANASSAAAVTTLLNGESIAGTDAFGTGESNNAGAANILPVYETLTLNTPLSVCTSAPFGSIDGNKLGNRKFLRFDNSATRLVTIQATGAAPNPSTVAATDPDIYVHRQGTIVAFGEGTVVGSETVQTTLNAGTYVIEVLDFQISGTGTPARCMNVSITG